MLHEFTEVQDHAEAGMGRGRRGGDLVAVTGLVLVELFDKNGRLKARSVNRNIITERGDQFYAERAAGIAGAPGAVTGMKLGTGSTTPAKTGAGAALVTYLSDSHQAIDGGFPTSALSSGKRRITWRATWAAGKATSASPITEAVLVIDTLADATSNATNTIARILVADVPLKTATDSLVFTWTHDLGTV